MRSLALASVLFIISCGGSGSDGGTTPDDGGGAQETTSADDSAGGSDTGAVSDTGNAGDTGTVGDTGAVGDTPAGDTPVTGGKIKYVWIIVEENHNWSSIKGSSEAPYINSLLTPGAHAEKYYNPKGIHPSEPNYLWMEAGDNLGITNDDEPAANSQTTTNHLSTKLDAAGVSWKSWQEDLPDPSKCPLSSSGSYAAKHNPFVFFGDVTNKSDPMSMHCIDHHGSTTKLETELMAGTVSARYNFITPNLCNDMHGASGCFLNAIKKGDDWLKNLVPKIQSTKAYKDSGVIFIVWDEGGSGDGPIGLIALSPFAKPGFSDDTNTYTHSSLLRTTQTIFGISPFIRDAAKAKDLSNLFTAFP